MHIKTDLFDIQICFDSKFLQLLNVGERKEREGERGRDREREGERGGGREGGDREGERRNRKRCE